MIGGDPRSKLFRRKCPSGTSSAGAVSRRTLAGETLSEFGAEADGARLVADPVCDIGNEAVGAVPVVAVAVDPS